MAEKSLFWYTNGFTGDTGDGAAPYTQEEFRLFNHSQLAHNQADVGIFTNTLNSCSVSGATSPLTVNTGRASVYGFPYWNDAALTLAVTTPSVGDTGKRVVLRAVWSTQTVRAVVISSADGVATIPSLTQTASTQWEIPLASFVIDTSGNIWKTSAKLSSGVTDTRVFIGPWVDTTTIEVAGDPGYIRIKAAGVTTSELGLNSVDDTIAGNRVLQLYRRQGGSASNWSTAGTTTYTPATVREQVGSNPKGIVASPAGGETVTFPVAFSEAPLVYLTQGDTVSGTDTYLLLKVTNITTTNFDYLFSTYDDASITATVNFHWRAIGPE